MIKGQLNKILGFISCPIIIASNSSTSSGEALIPLKVLLHASASISSAESIILAVGDVLSKTGKLSGENSNYHRLRMFSGTLLTHAGDEVLEHWLEHAHLMVEESDCSDKEKRRGIMECLRGLALAVVKAIKMAEAHVSPSKCLDAIESAFYTTGLDKNIYF